MKILHTLLVLSLLALSGCATAYISSETDPRYNISPTIKVGILTPDSATIEERKVAGVFEEETRKSGFNIVGLQQADYVLMISTDAKSSKISGSLPIPQTTSVSGNVGTTPYSGTASYTTWVPYTQNYRVKTLYATLYAVADIQNEKFMSVWEGYIGAEDKDFDRYTRSLIHELLKHFGGNYQKHTPINYSYK